MHEQQFRYLEAMLDKLESSKEALEKSVIDVAKKMNKGIDLINK